MKRSILSASLLLLLTCLPASAFDLGTLAPQLKQGGYVIVFRHGATDKSQKDVYPFNFADMKAQRQLSEKGRITATQIGAAIKQSSIPVGEVYTSRLHRAVETGQLLSGKEVNPVDALTDSGAGSATAMANPTGDNTEAGVAIRDLVNRIPPAGTNTILVTHKTNFADAFGKEAADVQEGEAFIYKPRGQAGSAQLVARVKSNEWTK